jgi:hypothetical protein
VFRHPVLITEHVFDKLRAIDLGLGEFEALLDRGVVIDEIELQPDVVKELVVLIEWTRPLHLVVIVDDVREEERILTVYEPDPARWHPGFRRRRS